MKLSDRVSLLGLALAAVLAAASCGGGNASLPPPRVSVSLSQKTATVNAGATAQFTATVLNDSSNAGITWTVSCATQTCGSVSPASTVTGAATTYTAPASAPASLLEVTLTATSTADTTKTASANISIPTNIGVQFVTSAATIQVGASASLQAHVTNDSAKAGLTWTVSCSTSSCGSVSPAMSTSNLFGYAVTAYNAPSTPPASTLTVAITATSVSDSTKSATATITIPDVGVFISPSSVSVASAATQQFAATVSNDLNSSGVTWEIGGLVCPYSSFFGFSCSAPTFHPCSTACGTIQPSSTASGASMTYMAPPVPPNLIYGRAGGCALNTCSLGLFIRAVSVTNPNAFGLSRLTILPISASVSPTAASLAVNGTQPFTATVTNDSTNSGVTWTLTQNGTPCSPACGTISPTSTASGAVATYKAPATVPALAALTVTATSIENTTQYASAAITISNATGAACGTGSGSESVLKGQYAFLVQGFFEGSGPDAFVGLGGTQGVVAIAGSFTADGAGRISGGELDINTPSNGQTYTTIDPAGSFYSVGPDHRGCLALANSASGGGIGAGVTYFRITLGEPNSSSIATAGHIIEFDDTNGTGTRASGTLRLQDPTSFTASQLMGNYAIGLVGADAGNGRLAVAGTFALDGSSAISSIALDVNDAGATTADLSAAPGGSFTCCSANGRGTMTLQVNTSEFSPNLAFYMISASDVFLVNSAEPACNPGCNSEYGGEAIGIASGTAFSQASLNSASVLRDTAQSSSGPVVDIAIVNADGKSAMTMKDNINSAGAFTTSNTVLNYTVASNGRVAFAGGSTPPVLYLYGPNQGFLVGTDPDVTFGILEPQAAGPFSNASLSGAYLFGTEDPLASTVTLQSGVLTADGIGNIIAAMDQSSSTGLVQNQNLNFTYSFAANGDGNVGGDTTAIMISGNKLVFISNTGRNPAITVVEK